jgi:hypothetical protein
VAPVAGLDGDILFVAVLAAVFSGVTYVLRDRELDEPPPLHPVPPPSVTPHDS